MTTIIDGSLGITFPVTAGSASAVQASSGRVLQVVNSVLTGNQSSVSSTLANTGLTATITPSSSTSKILVLVDMGGCDKNGSTYLRLVLLRGASIIYNMESQAGYTSANSFENTIGACSCNYLDSPATTSATTYLVQFSNAAGAGTVYVNTGSASSSSITLMEIAA